MYFLLIVMPYRTFVCFKYNYKKNKKKNKNKTFKTLLKKNIFSDIKY